MEAAALDVSAERLALALGLAFFFGLAFEEHYGRDSVRRPGGIRTFPMLALLGALLWLIEPRQGLAFLAGLVVVGALLTLYYYAWLRHMADEPGGIALRGGMLVPVCTLTAYTLGPVAMALPPWVGVAATVAGVALLTARRALHDLAERMPQEEIVTAVKFLALAGVVLPLVPNEQVHPLLPLTPYQAWLAVVAVAALSYASYLAHRYVSPGHGPLLAAVMGGLYSSTATTVALAKQIRSAPDLRQVLQGGILLATAVMMLRVLVLTAVFNLTLALQLAPWLGTLIAAALAMATLALRGHRHEAADPAAASANPLEIGAALVFALLLVLVSAASSYASTRFGAVGVYLLAGIVGLADVDPFVIGMAKVAVLDAGQAGGSVVEARGVSMALAATAIIVTVSANNLLKAGYALAFAGRAAGAQAATSLFALGLLGVGAAAISAP